MRHVPYLFNCEHSNYTGEATGIICKYLFLNFTHTHVYELIA